MLKNVVFDLGRVLIDYQPMQYLAKLGFDSKTATAINTAVFGSVHWSELDRGTYKMAQAIEIFCKDAPHLEKEIRLAMGDGWTELLTEITDTSDFLKELKAEGYKIYVLSNFHVEAFELVNQRFDFFKYVDGVVVSSHVGQIKPEREIYETLLNKYNLVPEETVFIDDVRANIDAGESVGIRGILFEGVKAAREEFNKILLEQK